MEFTQTFKELRKKEGLSVPEISRRTGIHKRTVEAWEIKNADPQVSYFNRALNALGYGLRIVRTGGEPEGGEKGDNGDKD
jgi:transcriptional regulator with XRE-family HTH domain